MQSRIWLILFQATGEYLCVLDGKYVKKLAQEIDQSTLFQFWSSNHQDLVNFWADHGDETLKPQEMTLIDALVDDKGNITI